MTRTPTSQKQAQTMMNTRASGKAAATKQQLELKEIRQMNKKNHQMQCQKKEEEDKRRQDEEEKKAAAAEEPSSPARDHTLANFTQSVCGIMEGVQDMETDKPAGVGDDTERSPLKKWSGSSKTGSQRTGTRLVSPPDQGTATQSVSRATAFLDTFIYPHAHIILELAITLKSEKSLRRIHASTHGLLDKCTDGGPQVRYQPNQS
jgi:hypothetical protein